MGGGMSKSGDINTLYKRFGGNAGTYQEIGAGEVASSATQRWPLLGELRPTSLHEAPEARKGRSPVGDRQVRQFLSAPASELAEPIKPATQPVHRIEPETEPAPRLHEPIQAQRPIRAGGVKAPAADHRPPTAQSALDGVFRSVQVASQVPVSPRRGSALVAGSPAVPEGAPDAQGASLQEVFSRLAAPKVEPKSRPSASPLKKLLKW